MAEVSVYCSGIRPKLWMRVFSSLHQDNKTDMEVIFVGPDEPSFSLPEGMKFVYSRVKPSQCYHIGVLMASGKYILNTADDLVFSPRYVDLLKQTFVDRQNDNLIVTGRYRKRANKYCNKPTMWTGVDKHFVMPVCSFMTRDKYFELGGIDRRFVNILWDCDLAMRLYSSGGEIVICNDAVVTECQSQVLCKNSLDDAVLIRKLWFDSGKDNLVSLSNNNRPLGVLTGSRSSPVDGFNSANRIKEKSQSTHAKERRAYESQR